MAGYFSGKLLCVEREEFEGLELGLEGGEEDFIDGSFYFCGVIFEFIFCAFGLAEGEGGCG